MIDKYNSPWVPQKPTVKQQLRVLSREVLGAAAIAAAGASAVIWIAEIFLERSGQ